MIESKNILISFIIGLTINLISAYLFFYLKTISISLLIFILIGSVLFIFIVIIQLNNYEIENRLFNQEKDQKRLTEKLKIHEQLIDMKSEIKELQKEVNKK